MIGIEDRDIWRQTTRRKMKETNIETNRQTKIIIMLKDKIEREIDTDIHLQTWIRARKKFIIKKQS